jgi:glycosyltransferase involved in cell wall biosynthesis
MTICIATSNYLPDEGGITTFNRYLSGMLQQAGHKAIILTVGYNSKQDDDDEVTNEQNGLIVTRLKKSYHKFYKKYKPYFRPGGYDAPNRIAMGYAMREWLLKNKETYAIDITEAADYGGIGVFLAGNDLPPVVLTGHGSLYQLSKYNYVRDDDHAKVIRKLEYLSYRNAGGVITHSAAAVQLLTAIPGCAIFPSTIPFIKTEVNYASSAVNSFALTVGGLQKIKGPLVLAEALKIIYQRQPDIKVKWIGGDTYSAGPFISVAEKMAVEYSEVWGNYFEWMNTKTNEEVLQLIASSSFVIIPSLWETFNYTALEAASSCKAIIITNTTGAAEIFKHGHDTWIIPANNPQALADAIIHLQNNPELCKKLGENAKQTTENIFDEAKIVKERITVYKEIINAGTQPNETLKQRTRFLKKYITFPRKLYFTVRAVAKKIIRRKRHE